MRIHEVGDTISGEADIVVLYYRLRHPERLKDPPLDEVSEDVGSGSLDGADHAPEGELLHGDEKVELAFRARRACSCKVDGEGVEEAGVGHTKRGAVLRDW